MVFCRTTLFVLIIAGCASHLAAQEKLPENARKLVESLDQNIEEYKQEYARESDQLSADLKSRVNAATQKTCEKLQEIQNAVASSDLDLAILIRAKIAEIQRNAKINISGQDTTKKPGKPTSSSVASQNEIRKLKTRLKDLEQSLVAQKEQYASEPFLLANIVPGFAIKNCDPHAHTGVRAEVNGRELVLKTHPLNRHTPCELNSRVTLSRAKKHLLQARVSHHPHGDWQLIVNVNGQLIHSEKIGKETVVNGWRDVEIDLSKFSGKTINLQLLNAPNGWRYEHGYWDMVRIVSE